MIEDLKKPDIIGEFSTSMLIPATYFASSLARLVCVCLKRILENYQVNYSKYKITQASKVKEYLENVSWKRYKVTISLVSVFILYPLIKFILRKNSV